MYPKFSVKNSLWLVVAAFAFSCMTVVTRYCGKSYAVHDLMFAKYFWVSAAVALLMLLRRTSFFPKNFLLLFCRCVFGVVTVAINTYLILHLPAAVAQTFNYTAPFWIAIYLILTDAISVNHTKVLAVSLIVGFTGICLTLDPSFVSLSVVFFFLCIFYGLSSAGVSILLRMLGSREESSLRTTFYFSLSSMVFGWIFTLTDSASNSLEVIFEPFIVLLVCFTLLYQITKTFAWQFGNTAVNSIFLFLGAPFVLILGFYFLEEVPSQFQLLGMIFILASASVCYGVMRTVRA